MVNGRCEKEFRRETTMNLKGGENVVAAGWGQLDKKKSDMWRFFAGSLGGVSTTGGDQMEPCMLQIESNDRALCWFRGNGSAMVVGGRCQQDRLCDETNRYRMGKVVSYSECKYWRGVSLTQ
jgi:hypothetical protein